MEQIHICTFEVRKFHSRVDPLTLKVTSRRRLFHLMVTLWLTPDTRQDRQWPGHVLGATRSHWLSRSWLWRSLAGKSTRIRSSLLCHNFTTVYFFTTFYDPPNAAKYLLHLLCCEAPREEPIGTFVCLAYNIRPMKKLGSIRKSSQKNCASVSKTWLYELYSYTIVVKMHLIFWNALLYQWCLTSCIWLIVCFTCICISCAVILISDVYLTNLFAKNINSTGWRVLKWKLLNDNCCSPNI